MHSNRLKRTWASALAVGATALAATAAHAAYTPPVFTPYPTIPKAGFPEFTSTVNGTAFLTYSHGQITGLDITATQSSSSGSFYLSPTSVYAVSNETYSFSAVLNLSTGAVTGSETITGKLPSLTTQTNLYGASLDQIAISGSPTIGLGFETTKATGWASKYQTGKESTWFYNFSNIGLTGLAKNDTNMSDWIKALEKDGQNAKLTFSAYQITTVPLPAAIWLMLSGLGALLTRVRRRAGSLIAAV